MTDNHQWQRDRENVAALLFLVALVIGGTLLSLGVGRNVRVLDCVTAGFRNCGPPVDAAAGTAGVHPAGN